MKKYKWLKPWSTPVYQAAPGDIVDMDAVHFLTGEKLEDLMRLGWLAPLDNLEALEKRVERLEQAVEMLIKLYWRG